jgi:hypothetical protein
LVGTPYIKLEVLGCGISRNVTRGRGAARRRRGQWRVARKGKLEGRN